MHIFGEKCRKSGKRAREREREREREGGRGREGEGEERGEGEGERERKTDAKNGSEAGNYRRVPRALEH